MEEYQLFPDIRLICGAEVPLLPKETAVAITYCFNGITEYKTGGRFLYLTGGKYMVLSISADDPCSAKVSADYKGLTLIMSGKSADRTVTELICDTGKLAEKVRQKGQYIAEAQGELLRTFTETLACHEKSREALLKIRAIEMLVLISNEVGNVHAECSEKIPAIGRFICNNISTHYTIPQLSELFELNPTTLKTAFKRTFGCSVYAYTRNRKMFYAAELLRETERKIIDIAADVGYSNSSKFAGAFSKVLGVNPKEYRIHFRMER